MVTRLDKAGVVASSSTTERTLEDRFAEVINVKDFGAKGDGVTDDGDAIQAAFTYADTIWSDNTLPRSYAAVYFPPGDYICTLSTTANRVFTFVNSFSVIIGTVSSLIWYGSFLFEGSHHTVESLTFVGMDNPGIRSSWSTETIDAEITAVQNVHNGSLDQSGESYAIKTAHAIHWTRIINCLFYYYDRGVWLSGPGPNGAAWSSIAGCRFIHNKIGIYSEYSYGVNIVDCEINKNSHSGIYIYSCGELKISCTRCMQNGFYGMYIDGRAAPHSSTGSVRDDGSASFESYVSQLTGSGNGSRLTDSITSAVEDNSSGTSYTKITTTNPHHLKKDSLAVVNALVLNGNTISGSQFNVSSVTSATVATLEITWSASYSGTGTFSQEVWDLYVDAPDYRAYEWRFDQCNINNTYFNGGSYFSFYNCRLKFGTYIELNSLKGSIFNNMMIGRPQTADLLPHGPRANEGWVSCGLTTNGPNKNERPEFSIRTPGNSDGTDSDQEADGTATDLIGFELNGKDFKLIGIPEASGSAPISTTGALWIDTADGNTLKVVT